MAHLAKSSRAAQLEIRRAIRLSSANGKNNHPFGEEGLAKGSYARNNDPETYPSISPELAMAISSLLAMAAFQ